MNDDTPLRCDVFRLPTAHPADTAALSALIAAGTIRAEDIQAIFGKTEGNGCVNDFTRAYAVRPCGTGSPPPSPAPRKRSANASPWSCPAAPRAACRPICWSSPSPRTAPIAHGTAPPSLAIGTAFTRPFRPEEIGRMPQIEATAQAVIAAMEKARITRREDVHYVQVKCPLLTSERVADAASRGQTVATADTYKSMGYSRGASALGVALALAGNRPRRARGQRDLPAARSMVRPRQHLRRHRADEQRGHRAGQQRALGQRGGHRAPGDAGCRRPAGRHRRADRCRPATAGQLDDAAEARSWRSWPRPIHPPPERFAARGTSCWTTATSTPPAMPAPWLAACLPG